MALPTRIMPTHDPAIPPQTVAEMRAYCRVHGIPISGPVLAKREYRAGPHPKSAFPNLPMKPGRSLYLAGQTDWTTLGGD